MLAAISIGSTPGSCSEVAVDLKSPLESSTDNLHFGDRARLAFSIEEQILLRLGDYPCIVQ